MSATEERDIATQIAETDSPKALLMARQVSEPWFRCQALAAVARYGPDERVVEIAEEAVSAALTFTDFYKKVAATAWPLRALIERGQEQKALQLLPELLQLSLQIENPVSRTDALFLLWQAFFAVRGHAAVLEPLLQSCSQHWKADYTLRQIVMILASHDVAEAEKLAASMPEGKYKRQAHRRLSEGAREQPHPFY